MKNFLVAFCLFTAGSALVSVNTYAQRSITVTVSSFTAKVNHMDSLIGAGSMAAATTTWNDIHDMLMAELANTKSEIAGATSSSAASAYTTTMTNQYTLYNQIWTLKTDLATNRTAIKAKLLAFAATI